MEKKLTLEHLAPYLPYNLQFNLPIESERYLDLIDEEPWRFTHTLETAIKHGYASAIELINSRYYQKYPFVSIEDGELFLGCLTSNLGWDIDDVFAKEVKPILRPLSDMLTAKIVYSYGEMVTFCDYIEGDFDLGSLRWVLPEVAKCLQIERLTDLPYCVWKELLKYKFDVFGIIDAGLAVDINTIDNA